MPHIDFDAAWAERSQEPLTITVRGETIELPARRPARHVLRMQRLMADRQDRDLTPEELQEAALEVFPEPVRDRLIWELEPPLDEAELVDIMTRVNAIYQGLTPEQIEERLNPPAKEDAEEGAKSSSGEAKRRSPNGSSSGGRRSKATSKRTTATT